jgi:hypothetical protein
MQVFSDCRCPMLLIDTLSSRAALVGSHIAEGALRHMSTTPSQVREINLWSVTHATRFLFFTVMEPWLPPFVQKVHAPIRGSLVSIR